MRGTRPLLPDEILTICEEFRGPLAKRDKALFLTGILTGFRVTELLSLRVGDVLQNGRMVDRVSVRRKSMKGKQQGRTVKLNPDAAEALREWIEEMRAHSAQGLTPDRPIFQSNKGAGPLGRIAAWRRLRTAFERSEITGKLGTHCMRKTFANRVYEKLGHDIYMTQRALGHKSILSTIQYLSFREEEIDEAIMSL